MLEVIRQHGICPENAMPAPGSLTGDSLANFKVFFPELERTVSSIVTKNAKAPKAHWQDSVQAVINRYIGSCPEQFVYQGKTYTPKTFPYYMVKNSWGKSGDFKGIWYMSRDYIALNTTYIFLNRHALPKGFKM